MGKRTAPRMSAAEAAMAAGMGPKRIDAMAMGRKLNPIRRFQAWMEQNRARTISRAGGQFWNGEHDKFLLVLAT